MVMLVQRLNIVYAVYAGFVPAGKDPVGILETMPVRRQYGAFAGGKNNIGTKAIFFRPARDIGDLRLRRGAVLDRKSVV